MKKYYVSFLLLLLGIASAQASVVITAEPQDQIVAENHVAVFEVQAQGISPLLYQWMRDDLDIPGANSASYTTPLVGLADDGARFNVIVGDLESSVKSRYANLGVIPDCDPPLLVKVEPLSTLDGILVWFNEPVDVYSATDPFNYYISPSTFIKDCNMLGLDQVQLELLDTLERNTDYELEAYNIQDIVGNQLSVGRPPKDREHYRVSGMRSNGRFAGLDALRSCIGKWNGSRELGMDRGTEDRVTNSPESRSSPALGSSRPVGGVDGSRCLA